MTNPWNERYAEDTFLYGTEPNDFLREQAGRIAQGGRALCLAEGEGRNAVYLATQGLLVTGVDGSEVGLAKAQRLAKERGVTIETVVGDLSTWDLGSAQWDAVVSIWAHLPEPLRRSLHPRIAAAVRPGGLLLLEHYHPKQISYKTGGPPDPSWMLTLEELARDFGSWHALHGHEGERQVREGSGHEGPSYVTQAVLRKPA